MLYKNDILLYAFHISCAVIPTYKIHAVIAVLQLCMIYIYFKAMDVIKDCNLSMAIFAPGWVYENLDKKNFFDNQDRLVMYTRIIMCNM